LEPVEIEARAAEARAIINSPVYKEAKRRYEASLLDTLRTSAVGSLTAQQAHAKILVLGDIEDLLTSFVNDEKVLHKQPRKPLGG
jgi:predicted membrane protein